jgi:arginine decarboxylase
MNTKYSDLINQTYYFPQDEFTLNKDNLKFHNIDLMKLKEYGTPLLIYLYPNNINKAKIGFCKSMEKNKYEAKYYCYCTKSPEFIMNEAFKTIFILKLLLL